MGDVNLEIKLNNIDERVIKIEESGDGYITSVSNDFNVINKKLSLSNDITTKLAKLNPDGKIDYSNVKNTPTLDSWHKYNGAIEENTVNTINTDENITFHGIDLSKAYELWFDTTDGQQATVKSSLISGPNMTYTVNTPTAQTKFRLLVKGIN